MPRTLAKISSLAALALTLALHPAQGAEAGQRKLSETLQQRIDSRHDGAPPNRAVLKLVYFHPNDVATVKHSRGRFGI
jgi:hypothetical protein